MIVGNFSTELLLSDPALLKPGSNHKSEVYYSKKKSIFTEQVVSFWNLLSQEVFRVVTGDSKRDETHSWAESLTGAKGSRQEYLF